MTRFLYDQEIPIVYTAFGRRQLELDQVRAVCSLLIYHLLL